jgi:dTDP-4-dehydrorhamnose reductase
MHMRALITGKHGQLAGAFLHRLGDRAVEVAAYDERQLDVTDRERVRDIVASVRPTVVINCAAYNLVDKAEGEPEAATAVNAGGPRNLAAAARSVGAVLVHFSSDYVFDGTKEDGLYTEDDVPNPLNVYGRSKLQGEEFVAGETPDHLILRLSWVFGDGDQNFIRKLLEWEKKNAFMKIAGDEFSVPTHTETVVDVTLRALDAGLRGLYHLTNSGFCSRYEWARAVFDHLGIRKFIRPVSMDDFALPAKRPKFSAMSNSRIAGATGIAIPRWDEAVRKFLGRPGQRT